MKILLITSFFPPTHTAGTEKRTLGYALCLQRLRHNVQVVCAGDWDQGKQYWNGYIDEVYRDIPVRRIHLNWILAPDPNKYLYNNPVVEEHLGQWLASWKPDIVHITSCTTLSASVINSVADRNIPIVLTLTDFWFICPRVNLVRGDSSLCNGKTTAWECLKCKLWHSKILKGTTQSFPEHISSKLLTTISKHSWITKNRGLRGMALDMEDRKSFLENSLNKPNCVTAPSKSLRDTVINSGVSRTIEVIYSGHDLSWLDSQFVNAETKMIRFGYIGQIVPVKGLHILLSAFVNAPVHDLAQLKIYGDTSKNPDYMLELKRLLMEKPNANIEFPGAFPYENLGKVLSEIDVLIVPSQWHENNPRVIQEAFAAKTPVIASDVDGISEFVQHEVNGLLFELGNAEKLGEQIERISQEPELLKKLSDGIPDVKTIEEEVAELVGIYKDLVK